ncbi:transcriptional regulator NarL [Poriferisphaera corsica]|uniref:Transcriptional regulator NarL n=1 Tax=Poriferisphaera corsica TaxID=2528020 RepID=A0A517YR50_9BACT|nr:LuxR C-terminal-related transcriptional regulator [Poriferisphaera corsica]QDU32703.1 transcriptional regulator NarL [Poriferisphaera corsica]
MKPITPVQTSPSLHQKDVRAIVQLFSKIAMMQGSIQAKKRKLMQGLCDLVDADYWLWNVMRFEPNNIPIAYDVLYNMPEDIFTAFAAINYELPKDEVTQQIIHHSTSNRHWTRRRPQLVSQSLFEQSDAYKKHLYRTDLGDSLISIYPINPEQFIFSSCCIHRSKSKPSFSDRDCLINHILISEVDWLHQFELSETPNSPPAPLPPRLQTVFTLIIEGYTPKRIAHLLNLTENTVRTYIRHIYKHFKVSSRIELTKRFTHGDGNQLPS